MLDYLSGKCQIIDRFEKMEKPCFNAAGEKLMFVKQYRAIKGGYQSSIAQKHKQFT
jgi:hypothetical protein